METQVLSIEQMQELKELGIDTSNSVIGWFKWNNEDTWYLLNETIVQRREKVETMIESNCFYEDDYRSYKYTFIPTFILQDILSMLPIGYHIETDRHTKGHIVYSIHQDWDNGQICWGDNLLEVAFNMLKWVKQNGYI